MANEILSSTDKDAEYKRNFVCIGNDTVSCSIWN